jgi:hypothetical protein
MNLRVVFFAVLLFLASGCLSEAGAQAKGQSTESAEIVRVPHMTAQDMVKVAQNIYASPPTLALIPHSPQAHPGNVWVRATDDGLVVWGKVQVDQKDLRWPQQKSEMLSSDHVEVWLATSPEVPMPTMGWGNQFGTEELGSLKDCAGQTDNSGDQVIGEKNCERWYGEQVQYREYLRRLFVRQWLIASSQYQTRFFEDFATTAYSGLNANVFHDNLPAVLQPKSDDGVTVEIGGESRPETKHDAAGNAYPSGHQTGYNFQVFIPYGAFPPARQLKLAELYLMVDVFSSAPDGHKMGDYSSSSSARQWGRPASFNHLRLDSPRTFAVTPCDNKPEQSDMYGESFESWFFPAEPGKNAVVRSTFSLINPAAGYMYGPVGVSPEAVPQTYFWKELENGGTVCGPNLAWRRGGTVKRTKFSVEEKYFETKALPDGWSLVRSGPFTRTHSPFGSGQCGSCEIADFDLFAVSPQGEITSALNIDQDLSGMFGSPQASDLAIAPDWKQITLYLEYEDDEQQDPKPNWTSTTYCLEGHAYEKCGESKQAKAPEPANFKELRGDND